MVRTRMLIVPVDAQMSNDDCRSLANDLESLLPYHRVTTVRGVLGSMVEVEV